MFNLFYLNYYVFKLPFQTMAENLRNYNNFINQFKEGIAIFLHFPFYLAIYQVQKEGSVNTYFPHNLRSTFPIHLVFGCESVTLKFCFETILLRPLFEVPGCCWLQRCAWCYFHLFSEMPQIETTSLQIETDLPKIETDLPQTETALPQIETDLSQIETALPQIKILSYELENIYHPN